MKSILLVLKYFYLPFSSLLLVLSIMFLSSFYLVLSFALFNKIRLREILKDDSYKATNSKNIIISVFSGFSFSIVLIGILFKLLLWPGGQIQLTVGIVSLMFSVLIVFTLIKKDRAFFILKRAFLFLGISSFLYFISNETLLNHYYPNEKARTLNTFIPGLSRDLHVDDTSVYIGIDYFLGPKATFRPQNYQYILKRYVPEAIAPMTMMFISGKYNESNMGSNTLLSEMIYYGKAFYFTKKMLPCSPDSLIVGFSTEEITGSEKHLANVWAYFIEKELLYITQEREKQRYVGERPNVTEIGNKCPGRIGQYVGWQIVKAYMENNDVTLAELLNAPAQTVFNKSKYKPRQ